MRRIPRACAEAVPCAPQRARRERPPPPPATIARGADMSGSRDCGACSRIAVTVVACVALSCALPVQAAALADDVHRLILAERYDAADRRAQAAFDAATGDTPEAIERRIQALQLLLDSANTQYRL